MMAELKRKPQTRSEQTRGEQTRNDPLTTADLAGRRESEILDRGPIDDEQELAGGPTLVRKAASTPLFSKAEVTELRDRWTDVQSAFVDEPREAVQEADKLVATVMQRLADGFANERSNLENQWTRGADVSTEDFRVALQRYRSFFDRLLNA